MKRTFSGLAMVAAGFAMMVAAIPGSAQAGSVVDDLRSRGLGKWVDRYVEEDDKGKVSYKSSKSTTSSDSKSTSAPAKTPTTKTLKAKAPTSKSLKKVSKKNSKKKFSAKKAWKKSATRKLSKKKAYKKKTKKIAKKRTTQKVSSNTKKKYKVPSRVKDHLASYGINF